MHIRVQKHVALASSDLPVVAAAVALVLACQMCPQLIAAAPLAAVAAPAKRSANQLQTCHVNQHHFAFFGHLLHDAFSTQECCVQLRNKTYILPVPILLTGPLAVMLAGAGTAIGQYASLYTQQHKNQVEEVV